MARVSVTCEPQAPELKRTTPLLFRRSPGRTRACSCTLAARETSASPVSLFEDAAPGIPQRPPFNRKSVGASFSSRISIDTGIKNLSHVPDPRLCTAAPPRP